MSPPVIVIIPTSFSDSSLYDEPVRYLRERGYSAHALSPPTGPGGYKPNTPAPSMSDDAAYIKNFVTDLADNGKGVVIMAHSYGAVPASQCLRGLTAKERRAEGRAGGVVRMAYVTGVIPKIGENTIAAVSAAKGAAPPEVTVNEFGWMTQTDPEKTALKVFNSLPRERGQVLCKSFGHHAAPAFVEPFTYAGFSALPVSWYFCEDDLSVVPEVQQNGINTIEESWGGSERDGKRVEVTRNKCDHMPFYSAPDHFYSWVESVISKGDEE